ncbi:serine/threonine-protein phosphatase 6 regulatory subunit 3-like isoform X2 [Gigantopelta aegis]|uniref:serine/threonine-protein phosphatase 6 regulatory subunit 3-like isoform X2 n=1 Tax=Gigantopelta aegis TaxID=1735272 RepID=UPI001B88C4AB|nr:serine/threonine-protein phosphatase 6 regulatory subunit 3-like isoform X2 [Gigantopelta aegis]
MFWKFNLMTSSHIDTLLEKEDVTLSELMDEDDILQECKAQNRKLIDFVVRPEHMEEMVRLITQEPPDDVDEKLRFKYPNTACELLTSDVSQINDKLASSEELVEKLYSFLESEKPLNPLLASFFSKVMGLLITRKSEMIFEYLKSQKDFVGSLLSHIGTSAIMDLLLRLITCIESPEVRRAVIEWLNEQRVVERLVASIVPSTDDDIHCNAAQSLCDIVRLGREQIIQQQDSSDPDPLLVTMELEETVSKLLSNLLNTEKNESVLVNGLFVIHTLLEVRKQGPEVANDHMTAQDAERLTQGVNSVLAAITPRLKDFHNLLLDPPKQHFSTMPTTFGTLDPPLGNTRLQIARLITALLSTNTHSVNVELAHLGTVSILLDLYFKYIWNNFLHTQVEQCIVTILNNHPVEEEGKKENPLLSQLFSETKVIQRVLEEWDENDQLQSKEGGRRKGFMGHLTKVANSIKASLDKGENAEFIKQCFDEVADEYKEKWEAFLSSSLTDINQKNTIESMKGHPLVSSSEDDDADFKDIPFPQDTAMQQLQQMTSNFIDQFGFNEDEFAEQEDKIDAPFTERISSIDFNIPANEETHSNSSMFEQACNEKIHQFDDNDSDEDIWEEKPITFDKSPQHNRPSRLTAETVRANSSDEDSTDSEEELNSPRVIKQQPSAEKMDIDANEGNWTAQFDEVPMEASSETMETVIPWEADQGAALETPETTEENWADFSKFTSVATVDFEKTKQGPRSSSPVAMDTTENTRSSAYVVKNASADADPDVKSSPPAAAAVDEVKPTPPQADVVAEKQDDAPSLTQEDLSQESAPPLPSSSPPRENCSLLHDREVIEASGDSVAAEASIENNAKPKQEKDGDSFLASSGLIKITQPAEAIVLKNGPAEGDTSLDINPKVQEASSQAKETLASYEKPVTDSPVPNGPV